VDIFVIKVAPDVIPMGWWRVHRHKFPCTSQLARKWYINSFWKIVFWLWVSIDSKVFKAKRQCTMG